MDGAPEQNNKPPIALNQRLLSGCILAPLTILPILVNQWTFMAFVTVAAVISLYEWYKMAGATPHPTRTMVAGGIYLMICFISFVFLRLGFDQGGWLAVGIVLAVSASDTGAYYIGRAVGGSKLAPRISPKKTWAGAGGAMFCCGLMLMILAGAGRFIPHDWLNTDLDLKPQYVWRVFFFGCVLGAVGQAGDLFISWFKRRAGLKDTGDLIPGHGGLLDRIDSTLLVVPVFLVAMMIWLAPK